jgi:hypothetical protein
MASETGFKVDLDGYDPVFEGEEEGLVIKGYEIEGEYLLDFDWKPDSKWAFLDDEDKFREFTVGLIERLTGVKMTSVEIDQLEFYRSSQEVEDVEEVDAACAAD